MDEESPQVTVLMSVYNGRPYLQTAVESILDQTYRDYEFLIVDDASTDGSRSKLKAWADRDDRIRLVLHDENRGLGYSLHEGVKKARGEWVARMDADDFALPERLETQMSYLQKYPSVDVLGSWAVDIDESGSRLRRRAYPIEHKEIARLIWTNPLVHPTVVFRRLSILDIGSYDPTIRKRQDYELWFRCLEGGLRFGNVPKILLGYRFTGEYYERNDVQVAWDQAKMGWQGCWRIGASPLAYLGVGVPLVRTLLPRFMNRFLHRQLHRVDPRRRSFDQQQSDIT